MKEKKERKKERKKMKTQYNITIDPLILQQFKQLTNDRERSALIEGFMTSFLNANNALKDDDEIILKKEKEALKKQQTEIISKITLIDLKLAKIEQTKDNAANMQMASLKAADILNQLDD
jgi:hypothetical protein